MASAKDGWSIGCVEDEGGWIGQTVSMYWTRRDAMRDEEIMGRYRGTYFANFCSIANSKQYQGTFRLFHPRKTLIHSPRSTPTILYVGGLLRSKSRLRTPFVTGQGNGQGTMSLMIVEKRATQNGILSVISTSPNLPKDKFLLTRS
jgi:hypothetical protein